MFGKRSSSPDSSRGCRRGTAAAASRSASAACSAGSLAAGRACAIPIRGTRCADPRRADAGQRARRRTGAAAAAGSDRGRSAALRHLLRNQGHGIWCADRSDRSRPARQARRRFGARRDPRHRQRNHRDQEHRDVDRRAGRPARRYLQRRARLRPARAVAGARRNRRHHGEWLRHGLYRSRRQNSEDRHPVPRQSAAAQHLSAHRQPGRPARRRGFADLRRALAGRLARQCHRAAAWRSTDRR